MIYLILLLGLTLRLINLNQSLWLDEAITVQAIFNNNLIDLITKFSLADFHPPLHYILLWFWGRIFGFSEISLRTPSVIFGVLTILFVYLLAKELFNKKTALIAGLLLSLAPLHIYYSQEARMYSLATFAVTLSFYFLELLLQKRKFASLGYTLSLVLILYCDYLVYLVLPAQLIFILWSRRDFFKQVLLSQVILIIFLIPWLPIFLQQLKNGKEVAILLPAWSEIVGGNSIKNFGLLFTKTILGRISFDNKVIYGLIVAITGLVYSLLAYLSLKKINNQIKLLICWIIVPMILALSLSLSVPVFSYFRMLFILPGFYLFVAVGVAQLPKKYLIPALAFLVLADLLFLGIFYLNPKFQREDWRLAVSSVEKKVSGDEVILFEDNNIPPPFVYYSKNTAQVLPALLKVPAMSVSDIKNLSQINRVFVFEYLVDINDPQKLLQKSLQDSGFKKLDTYNFNGVGFVYVYER
ncbi:MAG: glycosyltransferase family 39 protein [Candidatus Daviesbacteria bacterium]|nr:glycosyltransferase family 39 protein [Candidatus Daviesbacteria bacterium]